MCKPVFGNEKRPIVLIIMDGVGILIPSKEMLSDRQTPPP